MKTKLFTLLLLFASIAYNASAYKIIIRGGSSTNKYKEIILTNSFLSCTGNGYNDCPVSWVTGTIHFKIAGVPMGEIVKYVLNQATAGRTEGQIDFESRLPCYWRTVGENIEIDIKSDDVTGLDNHD